MISERILRPADASAPRFALFDVVHLLRPHEWRGRIIPARSVGTIVDIPIAKDVYGVEIEEFACVIGVRADEIELDQSAATH